MNDVSIMSTDKGPPGKRCFVMVGLGVLDGDLHIVPPW